MKTLNISILLLRNEECELPKADSSYGITTYHHNNYYWVGAVKACGGISKMASRHN